MFIFEYSTNNKANSDRHFKKNKIHFVFFKVSHGAGATTEESHNAAASLALAALADAGIDCNKAKTSKDKSKSSGGSKNAIQSVKPANGNGLPAVTGNGNSVTGRAILSINSKKKSGKFENSKADAAKC